MGKIILKRSAQPDLLNEDSLKSVLERWLKSKQWPEVVIAWGHTRGIDIEAKQGKKRWIIEAKGGGKYQPMRVNYFLAVLGELLQRMNDRNARYSIALPDSKQYRGLWERLPALVKRKLRMTVLFVDARGKVVELS